MITRVDAGLDLPLVVQLQQLQHSPAEELLVGHVAQVEASDGFVGLHQFQGVERELVVPGPRHGQEVLPLAGHTVGCTWNQERSNKYEVTHSLERSSKAAIVQDKQTVLSAHFIQSSSLPTAIKV